MKPQPMARFRRDPVEQDLPLSLRALGWAIAIVTAAAALSAIFPMGTH